MNGVFNEPWSHINPHIAMAIVMRIEVHVSCFAAKNPQATRNMKMAVCLLCVYNRPPICRCVFVSGFEDTTKITPPEYKHFPWPLAW
jgi:hypothetical protein